MKTKYIITALALLLFGREVTQAQFAGGPGRGDIMHSFSFSTQSVQIFWTGTDNTDWFHDNNWSNGQSPGGLVDPGITAVIPSAPANQPRIDDSQPVSVAGAISIEQNASLMIEAGGSLTINGSGSILSEGNLLIRSTGLFNNQSAGQPEFTAERDLETVGWVYLASPASGSNLGQFLEPVWTQGLTTNPSSGNTGSYDANVYQWNNSYDGNETSGWVATQDLDIPMMGGHGYLVYVFEDSQNDGVPDLPRTLSVTGTEHGDFTVTTNNNDGGWTFLGNPYATAIEFGTLQDGTDITDAVYVWTPGDTGNQPTDPDDYTEPYESGSWATYSISSGTGDLTGGRIAPFQAFFVENEPGRSTVSLDFNNAIKTVEAPQYYFRQAPLDVIRLKLAGQGMHNSTWLRFSAEGTLVDRVGGDAWQLAPMSADYVLLATQKQAGFMDIGHYPLGGDLDIPLLTQVTRPGTYRLAVTDMELSGMNLYLHDLETGESVPVDRDMSYEFTIQQAAKAPAGPFAGIAAGPLKSTAHSGTRFIISTDNFKSIVEEDMSSIPVAVALKQNYPNPFNPVTQIRYDLPEQAEVRLTVYDMVGRHVATLVDESVQAGVHTVSFDASSLSSGVYVYRLHAGSKVLTRKLTLLK